MVCKLNKPAYEKLIQEDIAAIRASNCEALEREHIVEVLRHSIKSQYPDSQPMPKIKPLVWESDGKSPVTYTAKTTIGPYEVRHSKKVLGRMAWISKEFETVELAMQFCQKEHERRVKGCLE